MPMIPKLGRQWKEDRYKFEAHLINIVSSRLAKNIQQNSHLKTNVRETLPSLPSWPCLLVDRLVISRFSYSMKTQVITCYSGTRQLIRFSPNIE